MTGVPFMRVGTLDC